MRNRFLMKEKGKPRKICLKFVESAKRIHSRISKIELCWKIWLIFLIFLLIIWPFILTALCWLMLVSNWGFQVLDPSIPFWKKVKVHYSPILEMANMSFFSETMIGRKMGRHCPTYNLYVGYISSFNGATFKAANILAAWIMVLVRSMYFF